MTSPEEEGDDGDVASEKLGLSLSDGTIAEDIVLLSECERESWSF